MSSSAANPAELNVPMSRRIIYRLVTEIVLGCVAVGLRAQTSERPASSTPAAAPSATAQALYSSRCAGCHGLDGKGGEHGPNIATNPDIRRLPDAQIERIIRNGIPASGMPAFGSTFNAAQIAAVLDHLRVLQGGHKQMPITGDAQKGKQLFFGKAKCSECHMVAGKGGFLGADLSSYGASHSPDEIREAILDPNKNLDPRNGLVTVITRDNHSYSGIARNQDNFSIQLQTSDGTFHFFDKSSLSRIEYTRRSIMPSDYAATLSRTELDDLIAYLLTSTSQQSADQVREHDDR
jgi:cytochrome c oxidase cbb3-type subunit III